MNMDKKNSYIMKYISTIIVALEKKGVSLTDEQKKEIFTRHLNSEKSIEEIKQEINTIFNEIIDYYMSNSQYNKELYIPENKDDPLVADDNSMTLRKVPPKFGTIDTGYSHIFIISLIVIIIILLIVIYLAYLTVNK